ncbi:MAG: isoprenyl transferase [Thermodesulfobacteriota bacterium]
MDNIPPDKLPTHIAIIMDGNGRWAEKKRLSRINGHRKGIEVVRDVIEFSREIGIRYLTLYTFSRENWNRPAVEVKTLMALLEEHIRREIRKMVDNNIRFRAVGKIDELPRSVRDVVSEAEEKTGGCDGMVLQLALSYSGREEVVDACTSVARLVKEGKLAPEDITVKTFQDHLYTAGTPDPDLLIRTSGESRISNFLLWQMAYTEIHVTDVLWPDFTRGDLVAAIKDFQTRERRFGLTGEQLVGAVG